MGKNDSKLFQKRDAPKVLEGKDIQAVADYILSGKCKNVFLMVGSNRFSHCQMLLITDEHIS